MDIKAEDVDIFCKNLKNFSLIQTPSREGRKRKSERRQDRWWAVGSESHSSSRQNVSTLSKQLTISAQTRRLIIQANIIRIPGDETGRVTMTEGTDRFLYHLSCLYLLTKMTSYPMPTKVPIFKTYWTSFTERSTKASRSHLSTEYLLYDWAESMEKENYRMKKLTNPIRASTT